MKLICWICQERTCKQDANIDDDDDDDDEKYGQHEEKEKKKDKLSTHNANWIFLELMSKLQELKGFSYEP